MAQPIPHRGEVWLTDFGWQGKKRPSLVISVRSADCDRDLVTCVPRTTSVRNSNFEVAVDAPFLNLPGAFDVQGVVSIPRVRLLKKLGTLSQDALKRIELKLQQWLGIDAGSGSSELANFCPHYNYVFPVSEIEGDELASRCDVYRHAERPEQQQMIVYTCLDCQKPAAIGIEKDGDLSWVFPPEGKSG